MCQIEIPTGKQAEVGNKQPEVKNHQRKMVSNQKFVCMQLNAEVQNCKEVMRMCIWHAIRNKSKGPIYRHLFRAGIRLICTNSLLVEVFAHIRQYNVLVLRS